jgi:hypothetical protein
MKFVNTGFNTLKVNGSTLIIEEMWKKITNSFQYKCGVKIITCVLITYGKCEMQLLSNGFNMFVGHTT